MALFLCSTTGLRKTQPLLSANDHGEGEFAVGEQVVVRYAWPAVRPWQARCGLSVACIGIFGPASSLTWRCRSGLAGGQILHFLGERDMASPRFRTVGAKSGVPLSEDSAEAPRMEHGRRL